MNEKLISGVFLYILYTDGSMDVIKDVKRVTNMSIRSRYLYYETIKDEYRKGTRILKDKIECWELIIQK